MPVRPDFQKGSPGTKSFPAARLNVVRHGRQSRDQYLAHLRPLVHPFLCCRASSKSAVARSDDTNLISMSRPTDVKSRFYSPTSSKLLFGIFESLDCNFAPPSFRCLSPLADVDRVLVVVGVVVVRYVEVVDVVVVVVIVVIVIVEVTERGEKRLAWKLFALLCACLHALHCIHLLAPWDGVLQSRK